MNKITTIAITIVVGSYGAFASVITLDPSILPSNQGWDYSASGLHSGTVETNVFSVDGSVLNMNSMGLPFRTIGGSILYRQYNVVDSAIPTTLEWTSRTFEYEYTPSIGQNHGFRVFLSDGSLLYSVGIKMDKITLIDGSGYKFIPIDATEYHTYKIEMTTGMPAYNFYVDNVIQESVIARSATGLNNLSFGDSTGGANSNTDITALEFSQIPEPSTLALVGLSSVFGWFARRRIRN